MGQSSLYYLLEWKICVRILALLFVLLQLQFTAFDGESNIKKSYVLVTESRKVDTNDIFGFNMKHIFFLYISVGILHEVLSLWVYESSMNKETHGLPISQPLPNIIYLLAVTLYVLY